MTITPTRLAELRAMPYEEYLLTPEWQITRKRILKRDNYQCQRCHANDIMLNIHHYTYERLGCELDEDLVTLCVDCHEEMHRMLAHPPSLPFLHKCMVGLGMAGIGTIGLECFLNAPLPAEIGMLVGAFFVAKNSPALYAQLKHMLPAEVLAWLGQAPQPGKLSTLDIWLARKVKPLKDYPTEADIEAELTRIKEDDDGDDDDTDDDDDTIAITSDGDDDGIELLMLGPQKRITVFSELLKTGWRPSLAQIYVGTDKNGKHLFVPVEKLWHVALAGATGFGKSSLLRLLMAQLCYLKLPVVLLNPHYMIYDYDHKEDWTPYTPYLKKDPMLCKKMVYIDTMLKWMAYDLLERRKERASRGESAGKPFFFILDEFPDIKAEIKDAPTLVGKLLRQGRKYGIYLIVASQDYSVKTLGVEGEGAIRKCFRTTFYVGGDPISVKELLNKGVRDIPENDLGQGTIMLKCATVQDPIVVHVPYLDNESLYLLLGPTTFVSADQERNTDELEEATTATASEEEERCVMLVPLIPDKGRRAEDIDIDVLVLCWNGGANSVEKLMKAFKMTHHQAALARKRIMECAKKHIEEATD